MRYTVCIQAGMPKSGTAYIYHVLGGILKDKYNRSTIELQVESGKLKFLRGNNNNTGRLTAGKILSLLLAGLMADPFLVKTHSRPIWLLKILSTLGVIKVIYTYRDPRDVFFSARDNGRKLSAAGRSDTFVQFLNFDVGLKKLGNYLQVCKMYLAMPSALCIKYEDVITNPVEVFKIAASFLGIEITEERIKEIIEKYDVSKKSTGEGQSHFNKGIAKRYLTDLKPEELSRLNQRFEKEIKWLGYSLD